MTMTMKELLDKQDALETQEEELEARLRELRLKIKALGGADAEALALLRNEPAASSAALQAEREDALRRLATVKRAGEIVRSQIAECRAAEQEAQVKAAIPVHRAVVAEIAQAACALARLQAREAEVRASLQAPAVTYADRLRPMPLPGLVGGFFDIREQSSPLCHYIREAVEYGFLTGKEPFLKDTNWRYA